MKKFFLERVCLIFATWLLILTAHAETNDPLPSWNAGPIKQSIIQFVQTITDKNNPDYVPPADRIATFDNDGTLWLEQPMYTEVIFAFDRIKSLAPQHPEWKSKEPYQAILHNQYSHLTAQAIGKILTITQSGMSIDDFKEIEKNWLATTKNLRYHHYYTELVYQPMLEVMNYLRQHGFKVYIVSGGGQEFIRTYSQNVYDVPPEQVIGSADKINYVYHHHQPQLMNVPAVLFISNYQGKPEAINLFIGKKPIIAFGNSDGDRQMLEWTQSGSGKRLMLLVHHDDAVREYAYDTQSKVGTFSKSLMDEAKQNHWQIISMKNDWKVIFPFEKNKA